MSEIYDDNVDGLLPARSTEQSRIHGEYFRDLSANYSLYQSTGKWPAPPEGLVIVEPLSDADLARA